MQKARNRNLFQGTHGTHIKPLVNAEVNKHFEIDGELLAKGLGLQMLKKITKEAYENKDITLMPLIQPSPYPLQDFDGKGVVCTPEQLLRYFF